MPSYRPHTMIRPGSVASCDDNPSTGDVDIEHRVLGGRDQVLDRPFAADPYVIGRPLQHLFDDPDALPGLRDDGKTHDLAVIEATFLQRTHLLVRQLEVPTAEKVGHRPVIDPSQLDHQARLAFSAPLDLMRATVEHQACSRIEA